MEKDFALDSQVLADAFIILSHREGPQSVVGVQLAGQRVKRSHVSAGDRLGAFEAVVIPGPPVADFEALVAALNAVSAVALTVVGAAGHVHFGVGDK